jgi:hypothetical protein|tara:strand:+ start:11455 stop:12126 length:672 start_codon:yes stop_codon:yes gene_type:complete
MSKIFFFGCSYTYGHGLPDCRNLSTPSKLGWATRLADQAGKEYVNLSDPGGSNRQAVHLAQNCDIQSGDIAIFHWTFINRYFYLDWHSKFQGVQTTKIGNWMLKNKSKRPKMHYFNWSEVHMMHDTEILIDYINNKFEKKGIRCINFEPMIYKDKATDWELDYWTKNIDCTTIFDNCNLLHWQKFVSAKKGYTDLADDGDHPGLTSNIRFANYILEEYPWLKE